MEVFYSHYRGGSRAAATSKMERFVIIVNGFQPLTIITKRSILNVVAALDPPLPLERFKSTFYLHSLRYDFKNAIFIAPVVCAVV